MEEQAVGILSVGISVGLLVLFYVISKILESGESAQQGKEKGEKER